MVARKVPRGGSETPATCPDNSETDRYLSLKSILQSSLSFRGSDPLKDPHCVHMFKGHEQFKYGWLRQQLACADPGDQLTAAERRLICMQVMLLPASGYLKKMKKVNKADLLSKAWGVTTRTIDLIRAGICNELLISPCHTNESKKLFSPDTLQSPCSKRQANFATPHIGTVPVVSFDEEQSDNRSDPITPRALLMNSARLGVTLFPPGSTPTATTTPVSAIGLETGVAPVAERENTVTATPPSPIEAPSHVPAEDPICLSPSLKRLDKRLSSDSIKPTDDALLHTAVRKILATLVDERTGMVQLQYLDRNKRRRAAKVIVAPIPRSGKKVADPKQRKKRAYRKVATVAGLLSSITLDEKDRDEIIAHYVKEYTSLKVIEDVNKHTFTASEAICIRDFVGTSTNGLCRFVRALKLLKDINVFPTQLQKKISDLEMKAVPMECFFVELIVTKGGAKELCLFLRIVNPALLLERMIASAHIAGMQCPSLEISNYENSNIVFIGLDPGGGDTYLGIRNGNRKNGNQAEFCFPLATVENSAEVYDNCKQTFFIPGSTTDNFHQDLIDDAMTTIEILSKDAVGNVVDAQCVAIRLATSTGHVLSQCNGFRVRAIRGEDTAFHEAVIQGESASNRARASLVTLAIPSPPPPQIEVKVVLWHQLNVGYVGISLCDDSGSEVYSFLFERPLICGPDMVIDVRCNEVKGFPCHDGKCALMISGQASASCNFPCLKCIQHKKLFRESYPMWMHNHRPNQFLLPKEVAPLRSGEYSNTECFKMFRTQTGDGMFSDLPTSTDDRREAYCVVANPCAPVNPLKESGGPMHIGSGLVEHLILDVRLMLRAIDAEGPFVTEVKSFREEVASFVESQQPESNCVRVVDDEFGKAIAKAKKDVAKHRRGDQSQLLVAQTELRDLQNSRYSHATTSGLGTTNLLRKGAKEALDATDDFLKHKNKAVCGEAEYVFNKVIELTGARYRKEHDGMSLSNAHYMKVVEEYDMIATAVEATYNHDQSSHTQALRKKVRKTMKLFRKCAEPASRVVIILKRQEKLEEEEIGKLKDAVCDFAFEFRIAFPKRSIYPKLHWLECLTVMFAVLRGFIGLGSEEGFESAHNRLRWIKIMLHSMPFDKDRGRKMGQRYQVLLLPEFEAVWKKLNPPVKKRGKCKKKSAEEKESKAVPRLSSTAMRLQSEYGALLKLPSGNPILEKWNELYLFTASKIATGKMKALLDKNPALPGKQKLQNRVAYVVRSTRDKYKHSRVTDYVVCYPRNLRLSPKYRLE